MRSRVPGVLGGLLVAATTALPLTASAAGPARPGELALACDQLAATLTDLPATRIVAIETVPAGAEKVGGNAIGEHCKLTGAMNERQGALDGVPYAIGFEMRLPREWNGRFWYQANGGIDGSIQPAMGGAGGGPLTNALLQGFAVVSSDAGHANKLTRGPGFGIDPQARLDYGYRTVGKLTPVAKRIVELAYGRAADTAYIGGCSNGGRHAMVAASRYADQYDGYLIGAPGYRLPLAAIANIFGAQQYAKVATDPKDLSTAFTDDERRLLADRVAGVCDALDGLADGMVQATAACQATFDLDRDVPTCTGERNGQCLSSAQKQSIGAIFAGATTTDGKPFYASFPFDTGVAGSGVKRWEFTAPLQLDSGAVGLIWAVPPVNPKGFNGPAFVLGTPVDKLLEMVAAKDATYTESALEFMMPVNPTDLGAARARGAKILAYHGVSDAIFSVNDTIAWVEGLKRTHGPGANDFARLFTVPGMDHCRGGPSTDQFDVITPLVNWVEKGQAPAQIVASARGAGNAGGVNEELPAGWSATRTRPLCPHPQTANYDGKGDPEKASSFTCR
ncbi:MAG: tannase/feruloyl esterase family alpha/beta hydrolase [Burkholderiaceae bacterium]